MVNEWFEKIFLDKPEDKFEAVQKPYIKPSGFREYDVRWLIGNEINNRGMTYLGLGFATLLKDEYSIDTLVVGHDYRAYSPAVKDAFVEGLLAGGMNVIDCGLNLSPSIYFAQYHLGVKGCAMVTASHNENGWTGVKLGYDLSRTLGPEGIKKFKEIVYSGSYRLGRGSYRVEDGIRQAYIEDMLKRASVSKPLKIVVATGNGTAGAFTPEILRRAGHEVIERYTELDWDFPNFNPNPEDMKFLKDIGEAVRSAGADLGVGIDGDGDRLGIVDENGEEVFSDKVGLIMARHMAPDHRGAVFVVDVKSTGLFMIDEVLKKYGCKTVYWKTGHSYIKSKVHELKALAGFEKSGHIFLSGPYGRAYDDGSLAALTFCNIASKAGKKVSEILAELPRSYQSPTMAPYCADDEKYNVVEEIKKSFEEDYKAGRKVGDCNITELITVNGVRVHYSDGSWGLVRASSNKPSLVVVAESFTTKKRMYEIIEDIERRLEKTGKVGEWDQKLPPYSGEDD